MRNTQTLLLLIGTFLISSILVSQNLEVDKRNGFKTIKLGSHYSDFDNITETTSNVPNTIVGIWKTSDEELGYLFGDKIDFFELTFNKETKELIMLKAVVLIMKPYTDSIPLNRFDTIAKKIIAVLGKPSRVKEGELNLMWFGNEVGMSFSYKSESLDYDKDYNVIGQTSLNLTILRKDSLKENLNKGF